MNADPAAVRRVSDLDWEDRRQTTLDEARRRSAVIRILRLSFLVLAGGIFAGVAFFIIRNALHKEPAPPPPPTVQENEDVRMINPRFSGRDNAGRPYVVVAETATRRRDEPDTTDLVNPRLDTAPGPQSSHITAKRGVYDAAHKKLELFDDVRLSSPNDYSYKTGHARFFIDKDVIEGDQPVQGSGPLGHIRADSYTIFNGGEKVFFSGHVITHLNNAKNKNGGSYEQNKP